MKTQIQIEAMLLFFEGLLKDTEKMYSDLNQIDRLSGIGNELRKKINGYKGYIQALKWVLKDD